MSETFFSLMASPEAAALSPAFRELLINAAVEWAVTLMLRREGDMPKPQLSSFSPSCVPNEPQGGNNKNYNIDISNNPSRSEGRPSQNRFGRGYRMRATWTPSVQLREHLYRVGADVEVEIGRIREYYRNKDVRKPEWDEYLILNWVPLGSAHKPSASALDESRRIFLGKMPEGSFNEHSQQTVSPQPASQAVPRKSVIESSVHFSALVRRCAEEGCSPVKMNGKIYFPADWVDELETTPLVSAAKIDKADQ